MMDFYVEQSDVLQEWMKIQMMKYLNINNYFWVHGHMSLCLSPLLDKNILVIRLQVRL